MEKEAVTGEQGTKLELQAERILQAKDAHSLRAPCQICKTGERLRHGSNHLTNCARRGCTKGEGIANSLKAPEEIKFKKGELSMKVSKRMQEQAFQEAF